MIEFRNNYAHSYAISHWDPGLSGIVPRKINVIYQMLLAILTQFHIVTRDFMVCVIQTHISIYIILSLSVHISMFIRLAEVCNGPYIVLNLLEYHARDPRIKYSCVYTVYIPSEPNLGIDNVALWAVVGYTVVHWWNAPRAGVCTPMSARTRSYFIALHVFHLFSTSIIAVNFELPRHFSKPTGKGPHEIANTPTK